MNKIRTFILRTYKGLERCPYCGSDVPEGFEEEVKTIELEPLLDLLESTRLDYRPEWTLAADDLVKTVVNFLRENGRLK